MRLYINLGIYSTSLSLGNWITPWDHDWTCLSHKAGSIWFPFFHFLLFPLFFFLILKKYQKRKTLMFNFQRFDNQVNYRTLNRLNYTKAYFGDKTLIWAPKKEVEQQQRAWHDTNTYNFEKPQTWLPTLPEIRDLKIKSTILLCEPSNSKSTQPWKNHSHSYLLFQMWYKNPIVASSPTHQLYNPTITNTNRFLPKKQNRTRYKYLCKCDCFTILYCHVTKIIYLNFSY